MFFTIYRTTNLVNGKFYIGKHQTFNANDSYFGSGKALRAAIKKYGKESFKKEVLFIFATEAEMNLKELEIVTEDFIQSDDNYNLGVGGEGGALFKGRTHSPESIAKFRRPGKKLKPETREKISAANRVRKISIKARENMSLAAKRRWNKDSSVDVKEVQIS
jgi:hypothetical protein